MSDKKLIKPSFIMFFIIDLDGNHLFLSFVLFKPIEIFFTQDSIVNQTISDVYLSSIYTNIYQSEYNSIEYEQSYIYI
jgi:hypothetical protein